MKRSFVTLTSAFFALGFTASSAFGITNLAVGHNALHGAEHLIETGKVEEAYSTSFNKLLLSTLDAATETDQAAYLAKIQQVAGTDGTAKTLELRLDQAGKVLSSTEVAGTAPANAPQWSDQSASELVESAMHQVLHNSKPEYAPFVDKLAAATLTQTKDQAGNVLAAVELTSSAATGVLRVEVKPDGTLSSIVIKAE